MRLSLKYSVLLVGIISLLVCIATLLCGITSNTQIVSHRWIPSELFQQLDTATGTVKRIMWNASPVVETPDHGICPVGESTQQNTTAGNNITFYLTAFKLPQGRLGNRMFRYASILGLARRQRRHMFVKPDTDLEPTFKLTHVEVNREVRSWPVVVEVNPYSVDPKLLSLPLQNLRIRGYLQSFCYFAEIIDEVRREFTFQDDIAEAAANILRDVYIKDNSSMIVGVHVRRGDFLRQKKIKSGYGVPEASYFMKAFNLIKSEFSDRNVTFIVASMDMRWCKMNLLGVNVVILPPAPSAVHLAVLSSCDHVIITAGTFGWWAGWLANGYVIYFTGFMPKDTDDGSIMNPRQYYPGQWIGLGN